MRNESTKRICVMRLEVSLLIFFEALLLVFIQFPACVDPTGWQNNVHQSIALSPLVDDVVCLPNVHLPKQINGSERDPRRKPQLHYDCIWSSGHSVRIERSGHSPRKKWKSAFFIVLIKSAVRCLKVATSKFRLHRQDRSFVLNRASEWSELLRAPLKRKEGKYLSSCNVLGQTISSSVDWNPSLHLTRQKSFPKYCIVLYSTCYKVQQRNMLQIFLLKWYNPAKYLVQLMHDDVVAVKETSRALCIRKWRAKYLIKHVCGVLHVCDWKPSAEDVIDF